MKFNTLADEIKNVSNDDNSNNTNSLESVREQLINRVEQLITNPPVATATTTTNNNNNQSVASQYMNMEYPPKSAQMLRKYVQSLVVVFLIVEIELWLTHTFLFLSPLV